MYYLTKEGCLFLTFEGSDDILKIINLFALLGGKDNAKGIFKGL